MTGLTPEQYLDFERKSDSKHEYWNGRTWARPGGTFRHAAICTNIIVATGAALRGTPCRPFTSDLRLALYTYPDAIIVCGPPELLHFDTIMNPAVIFEVLSPNTAAYDRGEKFRHRAISALRIRAGLAGCLSGGMARAAGRRPVAALRIERARWVTLASVSCTLALRDIYDNVTATASSSGS